MTCVGGWSGPRPTLERALGAHAAGWAVPLAAETVPAVMKVIPQARRYLDDDDTRANTLHRVLADLPESGQIVLLAHSLGTVIAADLLTRLPAGIEVVGVITVGSPAGLLGVHTGSDRLEVLREPLPQVAWWLNVWGGADPVTGLRGISHRFPWVLDIALPGVRHPMENYLGSATVARAVGRALFGSLDRELSVIGVAARARDRRRRAERVPAADLRPLRCRAPAEQAPGTLPRCPRGSSAPTSPHGSG